MKTGEVKSEAEFDILYGIWQQLSDDQMKTLIEVGKQLLAMEDTPTLTTLKTKVVRDQAN